jgi:hypothetical protein
MMSTIELRHIITEHLSHIDDDAFLNAIKTIIESKVSEGEYQLSDFQKNRIDLARNELKNKKTVSHKEVQKEIDQWLNTK